MADENVYDGIGHLIYTRTCIPRFTEIYRSVRIENINISSALLFGESGTCMRELPRHPCQVFVSLGGVKRTKRKPDLTLINSQCQTNPLARRDYRHCSEGMMHGGKARGWGTKVFLRMETGMRGDNHNMWFVILFINQI